MASETLFCHARVVTCDAVLDGHVLVRDGVIADIGSAAAPPGVPAVDLEGDFLLPGLVELHTDNLEKHVAPRPGVWWPGVAAMVAHDAQIAAAGITTVYDALTLGDRYRATDQQAALGELVAAVKDAQEQQVLRIEHRLHLRCEVSYGPVLTLFEPLVDDPAIGIVSLMDHTPGERQFPDVEKYKEIYQLSRHLTDAEVEVHIERLRADQVRFSAANRAAIVETARALGKVLASHDDSCRAHVEEASRENVAIAEFPTTGEAARSAREYGLNVLMGSPNLVRGRSHSGNVAAGTLARDGLLDILSSDYFPSSLLHAAFLLADEPFHLPLAEAIAKVTATPAEVAGLHDRGRIELGRRGDLVRVRLSQGLPIVRGVWRGGERVA